MVGQRRTPPNYKPTQRSHVPPPRTTKPSCRRRPVPRGPGGDTLAPLPRKPPGDPPPIRRTAPRCGTHGGEKAGIPPTDNHSHHPNANRQPPPSPRQPHLTPWPTHRKLEHMFATESQTKTEEQPPTLAEIIREVTNNGQTIIDFFHDAMKGRLDGFEPCHRIAAARELAKRGDKEAIAFLQSFYPKSNRRKPSPAIGEALPDHELAPNHELAEIVREVTDNGQTIVCFLHDAMQGIFDGFKPCHRVACGKELLRRGFDIIPADYDYDEYEDRDDVQQCHDEPFDHKKYAREQFWRDGADGKALAQIYGSEEAVSVALSAVRDTSAKNRVGRCPHSRPRLHPHRKP